MKNNEERKKSKLYSVRIPEELMNKIDYYSQYCGYSRNKFVELSLTGIIELIEGKENCEIVALCKYIINYKKNKK